MLNFDRSAGDHQSMGHVILDRRQEPRFELPGRFRSVDAAGTQGRVIDLSLNGALLECAAEPAWKSGDVVEVLLELDESGPFAAHVRVAHVHGLRVGTEFQEMQPHAFEQLSDLVLALRRAPTLAKLTP